MTPRDGHSARSRTAPACRRASLLEATILVFGLTAAVASGIAAYRDAGPYGERWQHDPRVQRAYDSRTGRATRVAFDSDGDFRIDRWCRMDGERLLQMDADDDADGAVDRREYYDGDGHLKRTEYLEHGRVVRAEQAADTRAKEKGR